jgi:hypothetical protein
MNTLQTSIYCSIALLSTLVEGKYLCNLDSVPPTCHQHTQAIGLSSVRPERRLLLTFDFSTIASKLGVVGGGRYGILAPDFDYLAANQTVMLHAIMIASVISVVVYYSIISKRRKAALAKKTTTAVAGTIIGLYLVMPCIYFDAMDIKNPALRQMFALPLIIIMFRTLEGKSHEYFSVMPVISNCRFLTSIITQAYFGYTPDGASKSLKMYTTYYIFPGEILFDAKTSLPLKATRKDLIQNFWRVLRAVIVNSLLYSFLSHFDYTPFGRERRHYLHPNHLGNCFFVALYFQQNLEFMDVFVSAMSNAISGFRTAKMMDSPVLKSESIAEFWGLRWNYLVHCVLKRGVYKPIRKFRSAAFASLAVYLASGLFHEYLNYTVGLYHHMEVPDDSIYKPSNIRLGSNLAFFVWAFVVSSVEKALGGFSSMGIPPRAVPFFVVMTSLPFAFWFAEPYYQERYLWENEGIVFTIIRID